MSGLLDKRLVFVMGKGGVGRTTVAAALGLAAARRGRRTIVAEVAHQERLARAFGHGTVRAEEEAEIAPGLHAISIDPQAAMEEYLVLQVPLRPLAELLAASRAFQHFAIAAPGMRELLTIGKIWELAQLDRRRHEGAPYDLVIVDAPATGHGIGLMQSPKTFAEIARVGPMATQAATINRTITNPKRAGVVIVALPEEMPVNESASLEAELIDSIGISVDRLYMNGLYPERFEPAEVETIGAALETGEGAVATALGAAIDESRRAHSHREQLARLQELARTDVDELPFIFTPRLGVDDLDMLATEMGEL